MSLHILLADDDADDRLIFSNALKELRIKTSVDMVKNGAELIDYFKKQNSIPDLVFVDLNMPGKDGKQCLRELREIEKLKDTSIGIYSISKAETDIEQTKSIGASFYMRKPNNFYELKRTLHKVLKTKQPFDVFLQN